MFNQTTYSRDLNNTSNKLLFQKNVIGYLKLLYDNELKKNTTISNSIVSSSPTRYSTRIPTTTISMPNFQECDCSKYKQLGEENAAIWKLGFFTLGFITTFVALIIIISLIIKIISAKMQSKPKALNCKPTRKDSSKTSCESFLDNDTGICTLSSSSNYGLSNYQKEILNSFSTSSLINKDSFLKNSNHITNLPIDNRCFIYGISNKMLIDDFSNFYNIDATHFNAQSYSQLNTIPSSFRPNTQVISSTNEKQSRKKSFYKKSQLNKSCTDLIVCNEYDAIETPATNVSTINLSSATSYSEVSNNTLNDENSIRNQKSNEIFNENDVNFHYLNNNELISSTSILTQELESKLKERRQMIESRSKIFNEDENLNKRQMKGLSITDILPEDTLNSEKSDENLAESATISLRNTKCVCPCHSHLHSHTHSHTRSKSENKKHYRRISSISSGRNENRNSIIEENTKEKQSLVKPNKKAKIIIDSSSKLPTKRESIRMLIENKAVSENKQKDLLECHFSHLKQHIQKQISN